MSELTQPTDDVPFQRERSAMTPPKTTDCKQDAPGVIRCTALLCHVRMFKPEFAPLVEAGTKCQTVRPTPKRMPKAGDRISLRMWTGKPYRSKQRVLREAIISEVAACSIYESAVYVNGKPEHRHGFAVADGFSDYGELAAWFKATHGLPFEGVVIKWHNDQAQRRQPTAPPRAQKKGTNHDEI